MMDKYDKILELWGRAELKCHSDIEDKLYNFKILFAYNSGKIENERIDYHDTREIFENGKVIAYTGDTKTLFEQQNQKDCYEFLKSEIIKKSPLSIDLVKKIHFELTKGTYDERRFSRGERAGEFKVHDYVVGRHEVGLPPDEVQEELLHVFSQLNNQEDTGDVLMAGAYLHATLEYIHPFADGNGRVGRTLLNYYLITHDHPPIIIFDEDKKTYYSALEQYDTGEHLAPLKEFLQTSCIKTWERQLGLTRPKGISK